MKATTEYENVLQLLNDTDRLAKMAIHWTISNGIFENQTITDGVNYIVDNIPIQASDFPVLLAEFNYLIKVDNTFKNRLCIGSFSSCFEQLKDACKEVIANKTIDVYDDTRSSYPFEDIKYNYLGV